MVSSSRLAATAVALLSIRSSTGQATPKEVELAFKEFKAKYGRVYKNSEEEAERFRTFETKYQLIKDENAKNMSYFLTVNAFSDQTTDEFYSTHLGMRAPAAGNLWKGMPHLGTDLYSGAALPESVDWVKKGAVTKVKNQGSCGSCWAFSTTGSMEGSWFVSSGKLVSLSEQMLVDCNYSEETNNGCNGGSMDLAFTWLKDHNACSESSYPYKEKRGTCASESCSVAIPKGGVTGYFDVPTDDTHALMEAVAQQPVSVAIEADQHAFQAYGGGILSHNCGNKLDHGVLAVGYGSDMVHGAKVDYWKVKNSWGADWGEDGYLRIKRGVKKDGECGIKAGATYPKVDSSVKPSPSPPSPPSPPPSPGPSPPAPGCADKEDFCTDGDIFDPKTDCDLLATDCKKTCGCCKDTAPAWCQGPVAKTIVV